MAAALAGWLAGVAGAQAPTNPPTAGATTNSLAGGTNTLGQTGGAVDAEARDLKPHDVFRYRIEQDPFSGGEALRVEVTDTGDAHFNVSRGHSTYVTVKVAGRRLAEIRKELKEKLDAEYYRDVTIRLDLEGVSVAGVGGGQGLGGALAATAKVQIYGEMRGILPIPEGQRLMLSDVILSLPSNDFANLRKIRVRRVNAAGQPETHTVNIDKVLKDNDRSADFELKDGDRVEVPRKAILGL